MNANKYNRIRRIVFSVANNPKKGFNLARQYLGQTYRSQLGEQSYVGLLAELNFYEQHGKEFSLTVAGDMGEHADFAGVYQGSPTRFDVTTNLDFKKFSTYEPFIGHGSNYRIALLDKTNFQIIEVIDLAFDQCKCGGYLIPFVTVFGQSGESDNGFVMNVCSLCKGVEEPAHNMRKTQLNLKEYLKNTGHSGVVNGLDPYHKYSVAQYKYLRSQHPEDNLMGVAFPHIWDMRGPWAVQLSFKNKVIDIDLSGELVPQSWAEEITDMLGTQEGLNNWVDYL